MDNNEIKTSENNVSDTQTPNSPRIYTPEELLEKRRKERKAAELRARRERDKYYSFYDDVKTDENPSW